ncbi:MAG: hypothetical protein ACFFBC_12690 [Promethearchaeota archaeon]
MQIQTSYLKSKTIVRFLEPNILFRMEQQEKINDAMEGIQNYGPYDFNVKKRSFDKLKLILVCLNDESIINNSLSLLNYLKNGYGRYFHGLKTFFKLDDLDIPKGKKDVIIYENGREDIIVNKLASIYPMEKQPINTKYFVIAVGKDYRAIRSTNNYYKLKRICLKMGYPMQYFSIYPGDTYGGVLTKINDSKGLPYILWNICIAIYSKAGGIPWLLKNPHNVDITLALRFSRNKEGGYTTGFISIFNNIGRFMGYYSNTYYDIELELHRDDFKMTSSGLFVPDIIIRKIMHETLFSYQERSMNPIKKLTIQKLGAFGKEELIGFEKEFEDNKIRSYCLVEIFDKNILRSFNLDKVNKNIDRGICSQLSEDFGYLCTTGDYDYTRAREIRSKPHKMGTPRPLLINLRKNKDCYGSFYDACQDLFTLTGLHYQTVTHNELRLPASLIFALQIAKFSKYEIKPHDNLKNTPWFL